MWCAINYTDLEEKGDTSAGGFFHPTLGWLWADAQGTGAFAHSGWATSLLLVFTGVVTALPLLLFGAGARLIPLSLIGLLQYIAPTIQFLIGGLIYGEPFTRDRMIGFGIIWVALVVYTLEGVLQRQRNQRLRS